MYQTPQRGVVEPHHSKRRAEANNITEMGPELEEGGRGRGPR